LRVKGVGVLAKIIAASVIISGDNLCFIVDNGELKAVPRGKLGKMTGKQKRHVRHKASVLGHVLQPRVWINFERFIGATIFLLPNRAVKTANSAQPHGPDNGVNIMNNVFRGYFRKKKKVLLHGSLLSYLIIRRHGLMVKEYFVDKKRPYYHC
jgi:hypothetical protein